MSALPDVTDRRVSTVLRRRRREKDLTMIPHARSAVIICLIKVQLVAIIAALLSGGTPQAASAAPVNARVMTSQLFELVLVKGDLAAMEAIVAPDALFHTPEGEFRGYTGLSAFSGTLGAAYSNLAFTTGEPTIEGDLAAVQWTMSGVHTGDYHGVAATCTEVSVTGLSMIRFDESRIVEQWFEYDRLALVQQLQALSAIDTHSQDACAVTPVDPTPASIPVCGPDCDKPRGNR